MNKQTNKHQKLISIKLRHGLPQIIIKKRKKKKMKSNKCTIVQTQASTITV